jgi:UDP-2,3-diacylglucosamine pyrophosphatase LpxH
VRAILDKAHNGTRVIYIPGNHDEVMRMYFGVHFGGIEVLDHDTHIAPDGTRYLVTHGDQFDAVVMNAKWLAYLGDRAYATLIWLNPKINAIRRLWSPRYWSLSKWSKNQVKQAVSFITHFEDVLAQDARQRGYQGVICGHIHHAAMRDIGEIRYLNTGDWVESCTAIIENHEGEMRLVDWEARNNRQQMLKQRSRRRARSQKNGQKGRNKGQIPPQDTQHLQKQPDQREPL